MMPNDRRRPRMMLLLLLPGTVTVHVRNPALEP